MMTPQNTIGGSIDMLSIGVVARQTGIEICMLGKWESRYRFSKSPRRESGHRYFRDTEVENQLLIARRITVGERVGEVISESSKGSAPSARVSRLAQARTRAEKIMAATASALLDKHFLEPRSILEEALSELAVSRETFLAGYCRRGPGISSRSCRYIGQL